MGYSIWLGTNEGKKLKKRKKKKSATTTWLGTNKMKGKNTKT